MITALIAVVQKELLLLLRDKAGLLVLFAMPAVLVVVITLVQENALKTIGESDTRILLIDKDADVLGRRIADALEASDGVEVTRTLDGQVPSREEALSRVAKGAFQLCLFIPANLTEQVRSRARQSARESIAGKTPPLGGEPRMSRPSSYILIRQCWAGSVRRCATCWH